MLYQLHRRNGIQRQYRGVLIAHRVAINATDRALAHSGTNNQQLKEYLDHCEVSLLCCHRLHLRSGRGDCGFTTTSE